MPCFVLVTVIDTVIVVVLTAILVAAITIETISIVVFMVGYEY